MKRILVTGSTGLIGSSLLEYLRDRDFLITALSRTLPGDVVKKNRGGQDRVVWMQGDLGSLEDCERAVKHQDVVFHLAHKNAPLTCDLDWPADAGLNLIPTLNLLKAIQKCPGKPHLIYPSSGGAVYGNVNSRIPIPEDHPCQPENSYGIQKLMAEHYLRVAARRGLLKATILRISNVYGWLLSPARKQGFIGIALHHALNGQPVRIIGNPHNVRDYLHIDDLNRAFFLSMKQDTDFDIFNVGTGIGSSVEEVFAMLNREFDGGLKRETEKNRQGALLSDWCVLNIEKASSVLNWNPVIDIETGIKNMVRDAKLQADDR